MQNAWLRASTHSMRPELALVAQPIELRWNPSLPVFAKKEFLEAVGDEYGWLGGIDASGSLRCVLPYTILRKAGLRLVRFRTATISVVRDLGLLEEQPFLNSVVEYFRRSRADVIIPPSNNAIFRTCPEGAATAPYGTYLIDLQQREDVLWKNVERITRQNIGTARRDDVSVVDAKEGVETAYELIRETFRRSRLPFMAADKFKRFVAGLGAQGRLLRADYRGVTQTCCLFGFSEPCAYAIYAGNVDRQHQGSSKLLFWEAIRSFRAMGVRQLDFFGARIKPEKGSKQESINRIKRHLGATLKEGYMWKYSLRPVRALPYSIGVRLLRGGDIVDQESRRLGDYHADIGDEAALRPAG